MGDIYHLFGSQSCASVRQDSEVSARDKKESKGILDKLGESEFYMIKATNNGRKGNIPVTLSATLISIKDGRLVDVPGRFLKPINKHLDPAKTAAA